MPSCNFLIRTFFSIISCCCFGVSLVWIDALLLSCETETWAKAMEIQFAVGGRSAGATSMQKVIAGKTAASSGQVGQFLNVSREIIMSDAHEFSHRRKTASRTEYNAGCYNYCDYSGGEKGKFNKL